jgi:hypothetical protein
MRIWDGWVLTPERNPARIKVLIIRKNVAEFGNFYRGIGFFRLRTSLKSREEV